MDAGLVLLGIVGILVGFAGILIPVIPGSFVVWLATAGTLLLHRADATAWTLAAVLAALAAIGSVATVVLPARTGFAGGAARSSFALAVAAAGVGFFVVPVVGAVVGFLGGLLVGERVRYGDWQPAVAATGRVVRSYGIGVLIDLTAALVMAIVWAVAVLARS